jgi:hypothetical protein
LPNKQKESEKEKARRISSFDLFTRRLADAIKLTGAGNGTGLFAAIFSVNYFPQKPEMIAFLKNLGLTYLAGVILFVLSYFILIVFFAKQTPGLYNKTKYDPSFNSAAFPLVLVFSGASLGIWFYGTIRVALVIADFK